MVSDFDTWNTLKKHIAEQESSDRFPFPKEGQVWMSVLGKNIGFEQDGSGEYFLRPVLVTKKFTNHMFLVVPLSTKQKSLDFYYNFDDPSGRPVSILLPHIRLMSVKRFKRAMYFIQNCHFKNIKAALATYFS